MHVALGLLPSALHSNNESLAIVVLYVLTYHSGVPLRGLNVYKISRDIFYPVFRPS